MLEENGAADVVLWDERRSSIEHAILHASEKGKQHRRTVDAVAASLILEGYLWQRALKRAPHAKNGAAAGKSRGGIE